MTKEQFLEGVKDHKMEVLHDDGMYRHLIFTKGGLYRHRFELITYPNHLVICGDMGCYVFSRVEDMFKFFRGDEINTGYWREKMVADSTYVSAVVWSGEYFREALKEYYDSWMEDTGHTEETKKDVWQQLEEDILYHSDHEYSAISAVYTFRCNVLGCSFELSDFLLESTFTKCTPQYLWCLYAIVWGIQKYDKEKT